MQTQTAAWMAGMAAQMGGSTAPPNLKSASVNVGKFFGFASGGDTYDIMNRGGLPPIRAGYTGSGGKYDAVGVVHGGEYVVPSEGALVKSGGDPESHKLLREQNTILTQQNTILRMIAGKALGNVNISTNDVDGALGFAERINAVSLS